MTKSKIKKIVYDVLGFVEFYIYKFATYYRFKRFGFKIIKCKICNKGISEWKLKLQNEMNICVCEFCRGKFIYKKAIRLETIEMNKMELMIGR